MTCALKGCERAGGYRVEVHGGPDRRAVAALGRQWLTGDVFQACARHALDAQRAAVAVGASVRLRWRGW